MPSVQVDPILARSAAHAVRNVQDVWRLDNPIAHRMALRAMDQYALMLAESRPGLVAADEIARITRQREDVGRAVQLLRGQHRQGWQP